jgi:hypothetical protein
LDFTDRLRIVIVDISSQSKESWNLGIEAMQLELQGLTEMEGDGNQ